MKVEHSSRYDLLVGEFMEELIGAFSNRPSSLSDLHFNPLLSSVVRV